MKYFEKHPLVLVFVGVLGISLSSILIRTSTAPSAVTAAWRLVWTVLLLTPMTLGKRAFREELRAVDKRTAALSALSGLFLSVHFYFWFACLQYTTVASATTIVCTELVWVTIGFCLLLKGKISRKAVAAMAVVLAGSALIAFADSAGEGSHLYGDFLALLAAIAVAGYMLIGRVVRSDFSTTVYTYMVYLVCAAVLVGSCLVQGYALFDGGSNGILMGLLLAIFPTLLGHSIFSWGLKYFSPSFISAVKLCEPVFSATMAAFLFGEIPGIWQLVGGAMILGGVFAYSRMEGKE